MKLSIVLFVVFLTSIRADGDAQFKKIKTKCFAESGMTKEEASKIIQDNKPNGKMDCYYACILREQKWLNQDGTANKEVVATEVAGFASQENGKKIAEIFQKCFVDPKKKLSFCPAGGTIKRCMDKMNTAK